MNDDETDFEMLLCIGALEDGGDKKKDKLRELYEILQSLEYKDVFVKAFLKEIEEALRSSS